MAAAVPVIYLKKYYIKIQNESELRIQMLEDLKRTLSDLLNHEREIRDSL